MKSSYETQPVPASRFKNFFKSILTNLDDEKKIANAKQELILKLENLKKEVKEKEREQLKDELDQEVNNIIKMQEQDKLLIVIKKGYTFNGQQVIDILKDKNFSDISIKELILNDYQEVLKKRLLTNLSNNVIDSESMDGYYDEFRIDDLIYFLKSFAGENAIVWNLITPEKFISDDSFALEYMEKLKIIKIESEYSDFKDSAEYSQFCFYIDYIADKKKDIILNLFAKKLDKYNNVFKDFDQMKNSMMNDTVNNIKNFNEKDLPQNAQTLIKEIKNLHSETSHLKLETIQILDIENLYSKRLPQVLEEYITISPRYRDKLKSHNENPDDLLVESLQEIKIKLNDIFEAVQNNKHTQMKMTNRYLKAI